MIITSRVKYLQDTSPFFFYFFKIWTHSSPKKKIKHLQLTEKGNEVIKMGKKGGRGKEKKPGAFRVCHIRAFSLE